MRFQQSLFVLYEVLARRLRKQFVLEKKRLLKGQNDAIYSEVHAAMSPIFTAYIQETAYGADEVKQAEWEAQIRGWLQELEEYCKTCTPEKRKRS
jgi:hypothetical protein